MAIVSCLVDTNVMLRLARKPDPQFPVVDSAVGRLILQGTALFYTIQNIAELWNVMTRPINRNGFGLGIQEAETQVRAIESGMHLLPDSIAVYSEWRNLVVKYGVVGVHVHDARLAAAMIVHRIDHILTFNVADFARFSGIAAVHPASV
jgi:predicted nucleic acid-binding protein